MPLLGRSPCSEGDLHIAAESHLNDTPSSRARPSLEHFPRWLPLAGILVGVFYLTVLSFAGALLGPTAPDVPFEMRPVSFTGTAQEMRCAQTGQTGDLSGKTTFVSAYGATPDVYAIDVPEGGEDLVLVMRSIPDAAGFLACRSLQASGPLTLAGDVYAAATRPLRSTWIAFPLNTPASDGTYLLHVVQKAALAMPLSVQSRADFLAESERRLKVHIGFISVISFMVFYNVILAGLARMPAFIFNALTVASMLLHSINITGVGANFLWPHSPVFSVLLVPVAVAGPTLFGPFYLYRFIVPPEEKLLQSNPWLLVWPAVSVLLLVVSFTTQYHYGTFGLIVWWIVFAFVAVIHLIRSARAGNARAAVLLVAALGAVVPAMMAGVAKEFLGHDFGAFAPHLTELALLFEALLFTLALAYQIRLSRWREMEALTELNRHAVTAKRELLDMIDRDRTRLAGDLHDSAGQMLGLISSRLKKAAQGHDHSAGHMAELRETAQLASETLSEIRRLSHDLHPATLTHLGLNRAISALCQAASDAGPVRVDSQLSFDENRLSDAQNLQIYRIFQELIANTTRHSGASDAMVSIHSSGPAFTLQFSDNGQAPDLVTTGHGLGRTILRERVERLEGQISSNTGPMGTTVRITFAAHGTSKGKA